MNNVYIASAFRSPVTPHGGALSKLQPYEIAAPVIAQCLRHAQITIEKVDDIIVGNALGAGGNPARSVSLAAGLPHRIAGMSIDRQCASGLDALIIASAMIKAKQADIIIAGGVESYSRRPSRYTNPVNGEPEAYDEAPFTPTPHRTPSMAEAADQVAQMLGISKVQQDEWAINSHRKALHHVSVLQNEITPIGDVGNDTFTRTLSSAVCKKAKLLSGSISIANTAVAADAGAFCVVVSERVAKTLTQPCVRIIHGLTLGADPMLPALAPIFAVQCLLKETNTTAKQLSSIEIMEAYAAQTLACVNECQLDKGIVNKRGGAIARGHPIGASGAILAVRLYHEAIRSKGLGLAGIAAAGGIATAILTEN